jgi:hypothetical protein
MTVREMCLTNTPAPASAPFTDEAEAFARVKRFLLRSYGQLRRRGSEPSFLDALDAVSEREQVLRDLARKARAA